MKPLRFLPTRPTLGLAAVAFFSLATPAESFAQQAPPPVAPVPATPISNRDALAVEIGRATRGDTSYAVTASAPLNSPVKGQRLRLRVQSGSVSGTETNYILVNTGKSKTLGDLSQTLAQAMRRFAAGGSAPGQEFAKIGDIRYGGELRLVAETPERLTFRYDPPTPRPVSFSRADATAFANILEGKS